MTNPDHPYLRRVEVLIGPLSEWQGGGNAQKAVRIIGDGTTDTLRVKFSIRSHIVSTASPSVISIYNLSQGLRNALQNSEAQVVIKAGWQNTNVVTVFSGSLLAAVHAREGADIVTMLTSLSGFGGLNRSVISHSVAGGTSLTALVKDIASLIPGVKVDSKMIQIRDVKIGKQGMSFAGSSRDWLDKLGRTYGFNWWIDKSSFRALSDLKGLAGLRTRVSSANGFLIRAEPILCSPMQLQSGVSITSLFNPLLEAGGVVQLDSKINPKLNGDYTIHSLSHTGDTHSSQWQTHTETWWGFK